MAGTHQNSIGHEIHYPATRNQYGGTKPKVVKILKTKKTLFLLPYTIQNILQN